MRRFGLFLLLATTAMPALAQSADDGERQARREARAEARQERAERAPRAERTEQREQPQREVQVERQVQADDARGERRQRNRDQLQQQQVQQQQVDGSRDERMQRYREQMQQQQQMQQEQVDGTRRERLPRYRDQVQQQEQEQVEGGGRAERIERRRQRQLEAGQVDGGLVQRDRRVRTIPTIQPEVGQVGPVRTDVRGDRREGHRYGDGRRYDRDGRNRWSNHWRNDRRYDWRRHRDRHRSTFSIGFYFDPFGFNYRRFGIGSHLYSNYYQSNYWINDPWQYRLPPAYGPYRWVRYHNDAVLIDTYSGEVQDVIYGFFW